ncbi:MAG TPA: type III pantothenate kinase [Polyangiales bacterium]|jgi:type III pantothenate kinase|nr:type III pantothenate kinase [Polyangiales bacterium]
MLLVVDVGNTHTVLGLYEGKKLVHHFRIQSERGRTEDEYHVIFATLVQLAGLQTKEINSSILASVVPPLTDSLVRAVRRAFHHDIIVVGPGIKTGMPILYENPREVGADRIVNAIAAYDRLHAGVIVVDFGTATTFDCVSNRGEYLGGAIAPGIGLSAEALFSRAARLPKTEIIRPPHVLGRNTVHSMQSGLVFGYAGLVDGMVERLRAEMGYPCSVLATGGEASLIRAESKTIDEIDPHLTLDGLRILFERQK